MFTRTNYKLLLMLAIIASTLASLSCAPTNTPELASPAGPSTPRPPNTITEDKNPVGSHGPFSWERALDISSYAIRYLHNNINITRDGFIELLNKNDTDGNNFRILVNQSIASLPKPAVGKNGYQIQSPLINHGVKNETMYFFVFDSNINSGNNTIYNNYLIHCNTAPLAAHASVDYNNRFWKIFAVNSANSLLFDYLDKNPVPLGATLVEGAVVFKGGTVVDPREIMISPCPFDNSASHDNDISVHHIYNFAKEVSKPANTNRLHSFWYAVGQAARKMFDGHNVTNLDGTAPAGTPNELYISTHGLGVRYLHVRVENTHQHYHNNPALLNQNQSTSYFKKLFPYSASN